MKALKNSGIALLFATILAQGAEANCVFEVMNQSNATRETYSFKSGVHSEARIASDGKYYAAITEMSEDVVRVAITDDYPTGSTPDAPGVSGILNVSGGQISWHVSPRLTVQVSCMSTGTIR